MALLEGSHKTVDGRKAARVGNPRDWEAGFRKKPLRMAESLVPYGDADRRLAAFPEPQFQEAA